MRTALGGTLFILSAGLGVGLSAAGCGTDASTEAGRPPPPLSGTPTPAELNEEFAVFVTARGHAGASGSRTDPLGSLVEAIDRANLTGKRVFVCAGRYEESLSLVNGVSVVGGFDCLQPGWGMQSPDKTVLAARTSPAVTARNITTTTRLERVEVLAPDAATPSGSSIGILAENAGALTVAACHIVAGKGAPGDDGVNGTQLAQAGVIDGQAPQAEERWCTSKPLLCNNTTPRKSPAAEGGKSTCIGEANHDGEAGGNGGSPGLFEYQYNSQFDIWRWHPYAGAASNDTTLGVKHAGAAGAGGTSGSSAIAGGTFGPSGFTPADGVAGASGEPGKGGSGGDGVVPFASPGVAEIWDGNGGAAGGAGGCPGLAGTAGKGGGASVAVVIAQGAIAFERCTLVASDGGKGGSGTLGSSPTRGGRAGTSICANAATFGTAGGDGGAAGTSGSGAGGPSIAIAHAKGTEARLLDTVTTSAAGGAGVPARAAKDAFGNDRTIQTSPAGIAAAIHAF